MGLLVRLEKRAFFSVNRRMQQSAVDSAEILETICFVAGYWKLIHFFSFLSYTHLTMFGEKKEKGARFEHASPRKRCPVG